MSESPRESHLRWFFVVILVFYGWLGASLRFFGWISQIFKGEYGDDFWFIGVHDLDLWKIWAWLRFTWVFGEASQRFACDIDLDIDISVSVGADLPRSQIWRQSKESRGIWKIVLAHCLTESTEIFPVSILERSNDVRNSLSYWFGKSLWQNSRCNLEGLLFQYLFSICSEDCSEDQTSIVFISFFFVFSGNIRISWEQVGERLLGDVSPLIWDSLRQSRCEWVYSGKKIWRIQRNGFGCNPLQNFGNYYKIWGCLSQGFAQVRGIMVVHLRRDSIGDLISEIWLIANQLGIKDNITANLRREFHESAINSGSAKRLIRERTLIWVPKRYTKRIWVDEDFVSLYKAKHMSSLATYFIRTKQFEQRVLRVSFKSGLLIFLLLTTNDHLLLLAGFFLVPPIYLLGCNGVLVSYLNNNIGSSGFFEVLCLYAGEIVKQGNTVFLMMVLSAHSFSLLGLVYDGDRLGKYNSRYHWISVSMFCDFTSLITVWKQDNYFLLVLVFIRV